MSSIEQKSILLVDDDEDYRSIVVDLLQGEGFVVREAATGMAAIDYLKGANPRPNLVLLDVGMPGMSGLEVVEVLRNDTHLATVPIVVVTGVPASRFSSPSSVMEFLTKPFRFADLLAVVQRYAG